MRAAQPVPFTTPYMMYVRRFPHHFGLRTSIPAPNRVTLRPPSRSHGAGGLRRGLPLSAGRAYLARPPRSVLLRGAMHQVRGTWPYLFLYPGPGNRYDKPVAPL